MSSLLSIRMRKPRGLGTSLLIASAFLLGAIRAPAAEPLVIGKITIRTLNVYASDEVDGRATRVANGLHVKTREAVVRELLLFYEGEIYEPERLAETERNLRALRFIRLARVTAGEPHDGKVDVEVLTQDSWSTEPSLSLGSRGGAGKAALDFTERNLLGRGWEVRYRYEDNADRTKQSLRLRDPSIFGPYWQAELLFSRNSDGTEEKLHLERPFFSTESPWSLLAGGERVTQQERRYRGGIEIERYSAHHDRFDLGFGLAVRKSVSSAHRLSAGVSFQQDRFARLDDFAIQDALPSDRDYRYVWLQYDLVTNDYRKLDFVDRGGLDEDFNLGTAATLRFGVSPEALGAPETTGIVSAEVSRGFSLGSRSILLADASYTSRLGTPDRNAIAFAEINHITRFATAHPQTTLLRLRADRGWDLDRDVQFFADADSGLRGYRLHAFEGDQRLIVSAEHRMFLGRELFKLVSPGLVFFVDGGAAVPSDRGIRWEDMKLDAGIGLWLGMSRSGRNAIRIDLARAFDEDPLGRSGWLVSVTGNRSF